MRTRLQSLLAWCGPTLILLFGIGFVLIAGLLPPVAPTNSAKEVADFYRDDTDGLRVGILISMIGWTLIGPWGISMSALLDRPGRSARMLTHLQIACVGAAIAIVVMTLLLFGLCAFRPDELAPDTTRMLNDFAWFLFLFSYPPFSLWMAAIGMSILSDDRADAAYPRWAGFLNLWIALMIIPAGLIIFFKDGPLAFDGLLALYMPLAVFFIWIVTMTALTITAIRRDPGEPTYAAAPVTSSPDLRQSP